MSALALTVLAPLAGAGSILLLRRAAPSLGLASAGGALAASLWLLVELLSGATTVVRLPGLPGMPLELAATPLAAVLAVTVSTVGGLVMIYAVGYMKREAGEARFFALMSLFLGAMLVLVLAGDWILLLAAWELIGLCSYLLIGFWYRRPEAATAATRAFLYTRTADLGLYVAIFVLIAGSGTTDIAGTFQAAGGWVPAAGFLLLVAAMGKSAQVPLQDWLMRAMAGPTPVSALLHSATLVAAGAILLIRTAPVLPSGALLAVGLVGGTTTVVAGLIALAEGDLKRMLAASTASQYGLMLIAVGAGSPIAALLHLVAHAAIKSSLFLGAGLFQHARDGTRFDQLAGVGRARPFTYAAFTVSALALAGIPPLSGFFSKDAVIASALNAHHGGWLAVLAVAGTLLTGAYMARGLRLLWHGSDREQPVEGTGWMAVGLTGLVVAAAVLGAAFAPLERLLNAGTVSSGAALVAGLAAGGGGLLLGWLVPAERLLGRPIAAWARNGCAIGGGLARWVALPAFALAHACDRVEQRLYRGVLAIGTAGQGVGRLVRLGDERGIDGAISGLVGGVRSTAERVRTLQSGLIHQELAITAVGAALMFGALVWFILLS